MSAVQTFFTTILGDYGNKSFVRAAVIAAAAWATFSFWMPSYLYNSDGTAIQFGTSSGKQLVTPITASVVIGAVIGGSGII